MATDRPQEAAARGASEPLVLKTFRPSGPTRRISGWLTDAAILGVLVLRARRGASYRPVWITAGWMALMIAFAFGLRRTLRASNPYPERYDPRDEVAIPTELVARCRNLAADQEPSVAFDALRTELGLSYADAARALALILEEARP